MAELVAAGHASARAVRTELSALMPVARRAGPSDADDGKRPARLASVDDIAASFAPGAISVAPKLAALAPRMG